jgi:5-methyltetrahydrofolate corrinoid/iron sulfur protein methyltransferase
MFIIGELINGMYPAIAKAIVEKDKSVIQKFAQDQVSSGADALDINCGPASKQPLLDMVWLVEAVQEVVNKTLVLDSSRPQVIEAALKICRNKVIINSTTADKDKLEFLVPLAKQHNAGLIGITISTKGIPQTKDQRLELAAQIVESCVGQDFSPENLYLDPILLPINVAQSQMQDILGAISEFKIISDPMPKTIIGLSNISQGSKLKRLINRTFLVMAQAHGLDAAILNPLDKDLINALVTGELILNKQIYCDDYTQAFRKRHG